MYTNRKGMEMTLNSDLDICQWADATLLKYYQTCKIRSLNDYFEQIHSELSRFLSINHFYKC